MFWVYVEIVYFLLKLVFVIAMTIYSGLAKAKVIRWNCYKDGVIEYCE